MFGFGLLWLGARKLAGQDRQIFSADAAVRLCDRT